MDDSVRLRVARHQALAVVVLTTSDDRGLVLDAVRGGARALPAQGRRPWEILDAVRRAGAGGAVVHAGPADVVIAAASGAIPDPASVLA